MRSLNKKELKIREKDMEGGWVGEGEAVGAQSP